MSSTPPVAGALNADSASPPIPTSLRMSVEQTSAPTPAPRADTHTDKGTFVPVALLGLAMVIWLGFQCWQLVSERSQLNQARAAQDQLVENATNFRTRLDKVARETQLLADNGNANARLLVDELRKRGITINPSAAPATAPGTSQPAAPAPAK